MSNYHDLPEPPGEWCISISKENHICIHKNVHSEKIIATPDQSPLSDGWSVFVLSSDQWEKAPYFVKDADMDTVIKTIQEVATAIDTGETIQPVDYITLEKSDESTQDGQDNQKPTDTTTVSSPDEDTQDSKPEQQSLTSFTRD